MTKQELITACYKELGLDPEKNPQNFVQLTEFVYHSEEIDWRKKYEVFEKMALYIDSQEEE